MKNYNIVFVFAILLLISNLKATANNAVAFSYCKENDHLVDYGTTKAEKYDIAIYINDTNFIGSKISKLHIPVIESQYIKEYVVWGSTELALDSDKQNLPNLFAYPAQVVDGEINFALPEDIEVSEAGVYIGYSFEVEAPADLSYLIKEPLKVVNKVVENSLYLHSSRTFKTWNDYSTTLGYSSPIIVEFEGDFEKNSVSIYSMNEGYGAIDESGSVTVILENHGSDKITSISYTSTVLGISDSYEFEFETPISDLYYSNARFKAQTPRVTEKGTFDLTVTIDKVNGYENCDKNKSLQSIVNILKYIPKNRPLMEEFTGTGCGYCVRGLVAMKKMKEFYPDEFLCVSYHGYNVNDPMYPMDGYPTLTTSGFPSASLNRTFECDPYYGNDGTEFGIESNWLDMHDEFTPVSINVIAEWSDNTKKSIDITCDYEWVATPEEGEYRVGYILISDDLYDIVGNDSRWSQTNNYANGRYGYPLYLDDFTKGCYNMSKIKDYHFDDVVVLTSGDYGIQGSIENITTESTHHHKYKFNLEDAVNISGENVIQNPDSLSVIAYIVQCDERYGRIINSNVWHMSASAQIHDAFCDKDNSVVATKFYDMRGIEVAEPQNGLFVKCETLANGSIRVSKICR